MELYDEENTNLREFNSPRGTKVCDPRRQALQIECKKAPGIRHELRLVISPWKKRVYFHFLKKSSRVVSLVRTRGGSSKV